MSVTLRLMRMHLTRPVATLLFGLASSSSDDSLDLFFCKTTRNCYFVKKRYPECERDDHFSIDEDGKWFVPVLR